VNVTSSNALQILLLIGGLSILPAILFTVTGFTRILIVLGFIRQALGLQNTPPNQVLIGISLFLTLFVMMPTINAIKKDAFEPLVHHQISTATAIQRGEEPLREWMFKQTRNEDL
jgi:flagellar biosynthetic protein FliP